MLLNDNTLALVEELQPYQEITTSTAMPSKPLEFNGADFFDSLPSEAVQTGELFANPAPVTAQESVEGVYNLDFLNSVFAEEGQKYAKQYPVSYFDNASSNIMGFNAPSIQMPLPNAPSTSRVHLASLTNPIYNNIPAPMTQPAPMTKPRVTKQAPTTPKVRSPGIQTPPRITLSPNQKMNNSSIKLECTPVPSATTPTAAGTNTGRMCSFPNCHRRAQSGLRCKTHGGGARCTVPGCMKSSQGGGKCRGHGGGKRCKVPGCNKGTQRLGFCYSHGGIIRCKFVDPVTGESCQKKDRGNGFCIGHGGGKRCAVPDCHKSVRKGKFCATHQGTDLSKLPVAKKSVDSAKDDFTMASSLSKVVSMKLGGRSAKAIKPSASKPSVFV